jgi:hypothetical protein
MPLNYNVNKEERTAKFWKSFKDSNSIFLIWLLETSMKRHATPESVDLIIPGTFAIYKGDHIFNNGIPYIIVAVNGIKGELIVESYAMVPKRLLPPPFDFGEMPSQTIVAFDGACEQLFRIQAEMGPMDSDFFPAFLNFLEADKIDLFLTAGYLSPLDKVRELTQSDALRKYIDAVMRHYGKT